MPPSFHKLSDLAEIRLGQVFRTGIEESPNGSVRLVQTRDVKECVEPVWDSLAQIEDPQPAKSAWLQVGDVLLTCRGQRLVATWIDDVPGLTLCTQHLFIIRIRDKSHILPAFLAWQLNQAPCQAYFSRAIEGSNQQSIRRTLLDEINIKILALYQQIKIVNFYKISHLKKKCLEKMIAVHEAEMRAIGCNLLTNQMNNQIKGSKK